MPGPSTLCYKWQNNLLLALQLRTRPVSFTEILSLRIYYLPEWDMRFGFPISESASYAQHLICGLPDLYRYFNALQCIRTFILRLL
jgi:hypothetical protein